MRVSLARSQNCKHPESPTMMPFPISRVCKVEYQFWTIYRVSRLALYGLSKAPFIWRKLVPGRKVTRPPELSWASQLFIYFLIKRGEPFTWETKGWLGYKGEPPSRANVVPYHEHSGPPSRFNLVKTRQSEHARTFFFFFFFFFLRNGPDKNDSNNGNEHVGVQKRC